MKNVIRARALASVCRPAMITSSILAFALPAVQAQAPSSALGNRASGAFGGVKTTPNVPSAIQNQPAAQATITPGQRTITDTPAASAASTTQAAAGAPSALTPTPSGVTAAQLQAANKKMMTLSPEKLVSSSPRRTSLMSAEHSVIAEQNALAQSVRGKAVTAAVVAAAAQTPSAGLRQPTTVSQIGAFAQSPAPSNQHIATTAWKPTPGIFLVNGKARGFTVTPGGYLTIAGYGLGNNAGEVGLFGSTNPNRIGLQVVTWGDGEVYALLPAGLRGVPDQEMKLQVVTREGKTYLLEGALFHATREEVAVTNHLDRVYRLEPAASWAANVVFENASGEIMRGEMGESVTCRAPGTDRIVFLPLPNGFEVTGLSMQHGHTDSGDGDMYGGAGNRMFFPGYSLGDWRDETVATDRLRSSVQSVLYVNWGVWRSHSSPIFPIKAVDFCMSSYTITGVTAIGPAGVAVF